MADRMLRIGVIGTPGKWSTLALVEAIQARVGACKLIDMAGVSVSLHDRSVQFEGENLANYDALIVKKIAEVYTPDSLDRLEALRYLELAGVRIFSSPATLLGLIDRLSCTVTLSAAGIPMPETVITEDRSAAEEAIAEFGTVVLKPLFSTKARGMTLVAHGEKGWRKKLAAFAKTNRVLYIQKKLDIPGHDLGVAFLGGKYLATYARVGNAQSWNTTINSGGKYAAVEPGDAVLEVATRAQALFGLDFTCVDVVETASGPMVFEVSAFGGFRGLGDAHGIDVAALYADYVIENIMTQKE